MTKMKMVKLMGKLTGSDKREGKKKPKIVNMQYINKLHEGDKSSISKKGIRDPNFISMINK